jgi:hypothetical protein
MTVEMISLIEGAAIKLCTQVTKVTRPLLPVTKITEDGTLRVMCDQVKAVVIDLGGKVMATFPKKNGPYVCMMKVTNPRFKSREPFPRPLAQTFTSRAYAHQQPLMRWSSRPMASWRLRMWRT